MKRSIKTIVRTAAGYCSVLMWFLEYIKFELLFNMHDIRINLNSLDAISSIIHE